MGTLSNFCCTLEKPSFMQWDSDLLPLQSKRQHTISAYKNLCFLSVIFAFSVGLTIGILIPLLYFETAVNKNQTAAYINNNNNNNTADIKTVFFNNSYAFKSANKFPSVSFVENSPPQANSLIENGIYWGNKIERSLPEGYDDKKRDIWDKYVQKAVAVKMESGCGRMQNRLVTFQDGLKACVRYRQNIDQIQGELFSFYLAKILNLPNVAPSIVSVVDVGKPLWQNLRNEIASAQWNSNRPLILTQYISNLNSANIPAIFRPMDRHLNKYDVLNMSTNIGGDDLLDKFVELAQWSDLIVFDYLTANLDRIVNNLYNYQWNVNIMDAPAHNLAKKSDSSLLVFLDNESGMLHGYRLLKKYEIYHSLLLENLCIFRKETADRIKKLKMKRNIGFLLREMFETQNSDKVKEILPTIPEKSIKILNERIDKVYNQITRCESIFSNT